MKGRKAPPSHFLFKIKSKGSVEKYTSENFEAEGYKWNLSIYPTGNKETDVQDHISIYLNLVVQDSSLFPIGWEVNAIVNFFAYDFLQDEYDSIQDGSIRRFHVLQKEWGIPKFIDLATFNDPSNGYVNDNKCVFGVEVFIVKPTSKGQCLSLIHEHRRVSFTWKFENFSNASSVMYESKIFVAGNYKWQLKLYPNGLRDGNGNSISLFLSLIISSLQPNTRLYVCYILRAKDQLSGKHIEAKYYSHFSSSPCTRGRDQFVPLEKLKDLNSGFLMGDSCVFETEVQVLGLIKPIND